MHAATLNSSPPEMENNPSWDLFKALILVRVPSFVLTKEVNQSLRPTCFRDGRSTGISEEKLSVHRLRLTFFAS